MTRKILIVGAAFAALSLAACGDKTETKGAATPSEQAATPDANPAATVPTMADESKAPDFVAKAVANDMYALEAAKIALKRSTNAEVKAFAKMMADGHTLTSEGLKAAIAASGQTLTTPTMLPTDLQDKIDDLNKSSDKDFDKTYADDQVDVHQAALNLLQRYAQDGDVATLKIFAADTAPKIQEHLNKAEGLKNGMK